MILTTLTNPITSPLSLILICLSISTTAIKITSPPRHIRHLDINTTLELKWTYNATLDPEAIDITIRAREPPSHNLTSSTEYTSISAQLRCWKIDWTDREVGTWVSIAIANVDKTMFYLGTRWLMLVDCADEETDGVEECSSEYLEQRSAEESRIARATLATNAVGVVDAKVSEFSNDGARLQARDNPMFSGWEDSNEWGDCRGDLSSASEASTSTTTTTISLDSPSTGSGTSTPSTTAQQAATNDPLSISFQPTLTSLSTSAASAPTTTLAVSDFAAATTVTVSPLPTSITTSTSPTPGGGSPFDPSPSTSSSPATRLRLDSLTLAILSTAAAFLIVIGIAHIAKGLKAFTLALFCGAAVFLFTGVGIHNIAKKTKAFTFGVGSDILTWYRGSPRPETPSIRNIVDTPSEPRDSWDSETGLRAFGETWDIK